MKKILIIGISVIIVIGVGISIWASSFTKKSEEIQSFKVIFDNSYMPIENDINTCIFEKTDDEYECNRDDIISKITDTKLQASSFIVKYDDTAVFKSEVLNSLSLLDEIIKINQKMEGNDTDSFSELSNDLIEKQESLKKSQTQIDKILSEYYH